MAKESNDDRTMWMVVALLAVLLIGALWASISPEYLLKVMAGERQYVMELAGAKADVWIYTKTSEFSLPQAKEVSAAITEQGGKTDTPDSIRLWTQERILSSWLWLTLIMYRVYTMQIFFMILMPFTFAIMADGWEARLIRTYQFSTQSPIRHRFGVVMSMIAMSITSIVMVLPIPIPTILCPLVIVVIGWATWIWTCNLQKRV